MVGNPQPARFRPLHQKGPASAASRADVNLAARTGLSTGLVAVVIIALARGAFVISRNKAVRRSGGLTK